MKRSRRVSSSPSGPTLNGSSSELSTITVRADEVVPAAGATGAVPDRAAGSLDRSGDGTAGCSGAWQRSHSLTQLKLFCPQWLHLTPHASSWDKYRCVWRKRKYRSLRRVPGRQRRSRVLRISHGGSHSAPRKTRIKLTVGVTTKEKHESEKP